MSIQDVVDGFFELTPAEIKRPEHPHRKTNWRIVHARIGAVLFMMAGRVNASGDWISAEIVAPVWPPN